jgi:transcriptional regulator with XRE-family HTH domain
MSTPSEDTSARANPDGRRLGRAIRVRREVLDLKRRDLAVRAELSYPYVSEIENGNKEPSARALRQIAEALDLSVTELLTSADQLDPGDDTVPAIPAAATLMSAGYSSPAFRTATSPGGSESSSAWIIDEVRRLAALEIARFVERDLPRLVDEAVDRRLGGRR